MKFKIHINSSLAMVLLGGVFTAALGAQPTAFTYQGQLTEDGVPYSGSAEFKFTLWDAESGGTAVATNDPPELVAPVSNGLFTVELDFGEDVFAGSERFLQVEMRTTIGAFTTLSPRQPITPTPQAIHAATAANALTVDLGTISNPSFIGTTTNMPLELYVNNQRALRLEPTVQDADHSDIVNVVGGSPANFVSPGVYGATIGGGGALNFSGFYPNSVEADFGTVSGGLNNKIQTDASRATIGGGFNNTIEPSALYSTIGGGNGNTIQDNALSSTIGGGYGNTIHADSATIGGGFNNTIQTDTDFTTIGGGRGNTIQTDADYTTIGGGLNNTIQPNAFVATIPGGLLNSATSYAFAAGRRAKANHTGAFVWADSQNADFTSAHANEFAIRAANGVRIHNPGSGNTLLTLATERPWEFRQLNSGAGTALELGTVDPNNPKRFIIRALRVGINTDAPSHLLHVNGVARSTQSTWATSSDRRAKHHITALEGSLERIARLRPVSFEYTPEYAAGREGYEGHFTGFIAQEVEPVFPDIVETVHEEIGDREVDDFRLLNAGGLTPHVVAAIKELLAGSQRSEAGLEQLRAENAELRQELQQLKHLIHTLTMKGTVQ